VLPARITERKTAMVEPPTPDRVNPEPGPTHPVRALMNWLTHPPLRAFIVIFILSFGIRGFFLTRVPERYVRPHTRWEVSAIAVSLAERGEFADPYASPTGPTAHLPPIVPGIPALFYRVFGMTLTAGYAAWLFRIACYSTLYAMLPWVGGKLGVGRPGGVLAGLAGAVVVTWPGHGEALTGIMLGLLLVAWVGRWNTRGSPPRCSFLLGLAWGVAFHVQPALLTVMLGGMAFEAWWRRGRLKWQGLAIIVLGAVVACAPWAWRNYTTFHEVFFIRSNFGLELRMGNHDGAFAAMDVMDAHQEHIHPRTHADEAIKLKEIGEMEYMRQAQAEALGWIAAHPGQFLRLTGQRVIHFWCGPLHRPVAAAAVTAITALALIGAWRSRRELTVPQRAALLIPLLTFPLVYYVVAYMVRYTEPVNWILLMLAGAEVWRWIGGRR
jgi:hypothetical protein